jgi:hypothetical protein
MILRLLQENYKVGTAKEENACHCCRRRSNAKGGTLFSEKNVKLVMKTLRLGGVAK